MNTNQWHHRDLDVWQASMELAVAIYSLTQKLPSTEKFGLISQMRRAAVSIPSNIAEGAARGTSPEFARFLHIARGSVAELETQLELVQRLDLTHVESGVHQKLTAIRQMLSGLIRKITLSA
jgi:four helix bundle protein